VKEYLGLDASEEVLVDIASETGMDAMKNVADRIESAPPESPVRVKGMVYDRRTLLHKNHIRGGSSGSGRAVCSPPCSRGRSERPFPN
jgi:hypothetical protein